MKFDDQLWNFFFFDGTHRNLREDVVLDIEFESRSKTITHHPLLSMNHDQARWWTHLVKHFATADVAVLVISTLASLSNSTPATNTNARIKEEVP
eukprot:scaffold8411_cov124-Skeletonema_dohrnii-CCMP3373.AAC.1